MKYINGKYKNCPIETIDSAENFKKAKYLLNEYRLAFGPDYRLWISQKSCK